MKIDFSQPFRQLDGAALLDERGQLVVLSSVAVNAILLPVETDTGEMKIRKYKLATKLHLGTIVDVSVNDMVLIKEAIEKNYAPIIVGQASEMLENASNPVAV